MPFSLPRLIADYFAADAKDSAAIASCFTADATVIDEKQTHQGSEAIGRWKSEAAAKYVYTSEPIALDEEAGKVVVIARLTGNFPRSPADLRYAFTLSDDAIARLEIVP